MGRPKGRTNVSHSKKEKLESRQSNIESNWQLNCFFVSTNYWLCHFVMKQGFFIPVYKSIIPADSQALTVSSSQIETCTSPICAVCSKSIHKRD